MMKRAVELRDSFSHENSLDALHYTHASESLYSIASIASRLGSQHAGAKMPRPNQYLRPPSKQGRKCAPANVSSIFLK
jgi:hypothetical protein